MSIGPKAGRSGQIWGAIVATEQQDGPARVMALAKAGNLPGAISMGEEMLLDGSPDAALATFVGMLCCRDGDVWRGISHMRRAVELAPDEPFVKVELARAYLAAGANDEAEALARPMAQVQSAVGREMQRIMGRALLQNARAEEALTLFEQLTAADPDDFESWDGAGCAHLALENARGAVDSLNRATRLRPSAISYWINLARALRMGEAFEAAQEVAQRALSMAPDDVSALIELANAQVGLGEVPEALATLDRAKANTALETERLAEIADVELACKAFERAEASFRSVLASRADLQRAWLGLAKLLERTNRSSELLDHLEAAQLAGVPDAALLLLRARALRGLGRMDEALAAVEAAPVDVDRVGRAQLIGDICDRLGESDRAFASFREANALLAQADTEGRVSAEAFRENFRKLDALVTAPWVRSWTPITPAKDRAPMFIFGFPRSGTTLIDTMLSGHPDALVLEEAPVIDNVAKALGPFERLEKLSDGDAQELRNLYFSEVSRHGGAPGGRLVVDKNPLGLSSTPLLFRLFPDARFVFATRHPCDVVLSCFIMSSRLNANVASFYDFEGTAQLYDAVLRYWETCRSVLPLRLHIMRYETLIAQPEQELRALAAFAGLEWDARLLAHQRNAADRAYIGSPSYAQVAEPIYTRGRGRWLRYRAHMDGIIPILQPWIDKLGYDALPAEQSR